MVEDTDLLELINELNEGTDASRLIDARISVILANQSADESGLFFKIPHKSDGCAHGTFWRVNRSGSSLHTAPAFTTSIEAALTLVPDGWHSQLNCRPDQPSVALKEWPTPCRRIPTDKPFVLAGGTVPLALCAAALQAMHMMSVEPTDA